MHNRAPTPLTSRWSRPGPLTPVHGQRLTLYQCLAHASPPSSCRNGWQHTRTPHHCGCALMEGRWSI